MSTEAQSKLLYSLSIVQVVLATSILFLPVMYLMYPEQESLLLGSLIIFGTLNMLAGLSNRIKGENRSGLFFSIAGVVILATGAGLLLF